MQSFMDYIRNAFHEESYWDVDNFYSSLTHTAQSLLFFEVPKGLRINVSSLASPNFATSYSLGSVGLVDGSISYLYSSLPIVKPSKSLRIDLRDVVQGYRHIQELQKPGQRWLKEAQQRGFGKGRTDTLLYGRLFLPKSSLDGLYLRRLSPTRLLTLASVSDPSTLKHGATGLALLQQDVGKYSTEVLFSTDSALVGFRGLYNFGADPRQSSPAETPADQLTGRVSAGAELYYGLLNKSGGMSTGLRFSTLPLHTGFPYTMTVTLNPLMGNLSSTYAVKAGRNVALSSQFDFNFYSYESDLRMGCEIWRPRGEQNVEWVEKMIRPGWKRTTLRPDEDVSGVFKARWDQDWKIGILWEGRIKELLFSLGISVDFQRRDQIFRAVGAELQYSS